jgi:integrative and conjugative element protein (TIGR02256 family)
MKPLTFRTRAGHTLHIAPQALRVLFGHRQLSANAQEAGGVLLGRHLLESDEVVVDEATEPQATDRRGRFMFFRSSRHDTLARERWRATRETSAYLGLWHTHPESVPTPSTIDRQDWRQALQRDSFEGEQLHFIIVGTTALRVWVGRKGEPLQEAKQVRGHRELHAKAQP